MKKASLNKKKDSVDDLLLAAMGSEVIAKEFYLEAAAKAKSKAGKQLFGELAEMEQAHYENVRRVIDARETGLAINPPPPGKQLPALKGEIEGEFEPNKDEIAEVLTRGIEAEKKANARYRALAEQINDPAGKELFARFAEDERRHQGLLEAEYYQISNKGAIIWGE
ncbi:MAG TPA: ferritin family protein [bacterium]